MPSCFAVVARGSLEAIDIKEAARALRVLVDPSTPVQLLSVPSGRRAVLRGSDIHNLCAMAQELPQGISLYLCTNPLKNEFNGIDNAAKIGDVARRRWLMVDVDAIRPDSHQPATDEEHAAAFTVAMAVISYLSERQWPNPVVLDSGNGWHLLYRIDLENDTPARTLCGNCLKALGLVFDGKRIEGGRIDTETFKANQNTKLPGSWARKGNATTERPHRQVVMVEAPDPLEVVPTQLLMDLAAPLSRDVSTDTPMPFTFPPAPPTNGDGATEHSAPAVEAQASRFSFAVRATGSDNGPVPYAQSVYEKELAKLASCGPHSEMRNKQGWASATAIGNYIQSGNLNVLEITEALIRVLVNADYPEHDARSVVLRGLKQGMQNPKQIPPGYMNGKARVKPTPPPADPNGVIIRFASSIQPKLVSWLWPGRIPLGMLTTFAGQTKKGKTFVSVEIMSRVTNGGRWPDGKESPVKGKVLFITGDDSIEYTLIGRLTEAGADLGQVVFLTEKDQSEWTMTALDTLDRAMAQAVQYGASPDPVRLVVVDPPTSFMAGVDDHKNTELRAVLTPWKVWAEVNNVAVIFITHFNKGGTSVDAIMRVMGGAAWTSSVRVAFGFVTDPDDEDKRLFCCLGTNLGADPKTLSYRIIDGDISGKVEWLGEVDTTANEAVGAAQRKKSRGVVASEWLIDRFREKLEWPSDDLMTAASGCGISRSAMFEAKSFLQLPPCRQIVLETGARMWVWWVPSDWDKFQHGVATTDPTTIDTEEI